MFNKLYPVMMSVLALLIFSDTQSMNKRRKAFVKEDEIEVRKQRFELGKAEDHGRKRHDLHVELMEKKDNRQVVSYEVLLSKLEKQREKQRAYKTQFDNVIVEIDWLERDSNQDTLDELDVNRDIILLRLIKDIHVNSNRINEEIHYNKNKFTAVLAELKKNDNSEEEQLGDSSAGLQEFFATEFANTQAGQEAAFSQLAQSMVSLEQSIQDIPELFGEAEKTVEPVAVGFLTKVSDWWYGPSNLVSELSSEKISLDVLKKSPVMQKRINDMIARYPLTTKRDKTTLSALVDLYTALNTLRFKFVDAEVNSAVYNACRSRLAEEEKKYNDAREVRVLAMAKYLASELDKMVAEVVRDEEAIQKLETLELLCLKSGMCCVVNNEQRVTAEPEIFEMIDNLKKLSAALIAIKEVKEEVK